MLNTFLMYDVSRQRIVKLPLKIWNLPKWCSDVDVQAPYAFLALYIHTTMSASDSFKTLVTNYKTAQCQIFN